MATSISLDGKNLIVKGDLDRYSLADKSLYQFPKAVGELSVNLSEVTTVDTAGMAFILELLAYYEANSTEVKISYLPEQLIALAQISNVLELLPESSN